VKKEPAKAGDEYDWVTSIRRHLCVFHNNTGLGKKIKRAMNKRFRKKGKQELKGDLGE